MSFSPLLPRLLSGLFNNGTGNPLQNIGNPLNSGTGDDNNSSPSGDDFIRTLPPSIERQVQMRGLDGLPPGLARQLVPGSAQPPAGSPATPSNAAPSAPGVPNAPANAPGIPGPPGFAQSSAPTTPPGLIAQIVTAIVGTPVQPSSVQAPGTGAVSTTNNGIPGNSNVVQRGSNGSPVATPGQSIPLQAALAAATAQPSAAVPPSPQVTQPVALGQTGPLALRAPGLAQPPTSTIPAPAAAPGTTTTAATPGAARAPDTVAQTRADMAPAPPVRTEQGVLERLAGLMRPAGETVRIALPVVAAREATLTAAQAMGTTAAPPPLSAPPPQALADARPMGITGNERAAQTRSDVVMTPAFTGTGPARRGGRLDAFQSRLRQGQQALDADGNTAASRDIQPEKGTWFALQWTFWVLAIVAYGCLALALIAFLPATSALSVDINRVHPWASTIVLSAGLGAAAAAWWLARRLMRK